MMRTAISFAMLAFTPFLPLVKSGCIQGKPIIGAACNAIPRDTGDLQNLILEGCHHHGQIDLSFAKNIYELTGPVSIYTNCKIHAPGTRFVRMGNFPVFKTGRKGVNKIFIRGGGFVSNGVAYKSPYFKLKSSSLRVANVRFSNKGLSRSQVAIDHTGKRLIRKRCWMMDPNGACRYRSKRS